MEENMKIFKLVLVLLLSIYLNSCGLFGKTSDQSQTSNNKKVRYNSKKWKKLPKVLDFYDEVKTVKTEFKVEQYADGEVVDVTKGEYLYSRGESKWIYKKDGKISRTIECYVDKVKIIIPGKKRKRGRRRRKKHKEKVIEIEAKYACLLQALVHYSGEVKKNRLNWGGKIYIVNEFSFKKREIQKVTLVKSDGATMVYTFTNIEFTPLDGEKLPFNEKKEEPVKPIKAVKKVDVKKKPVNGKDNKSKKVKPVKTVKTVKKPVKIDKKKELSDDEEPPM
jgi:hypothetical protein